jgi:D-alanine-D-alanine ligase
MSKTRILVLFGGKSGEHDVSLNSARSVVDALDHDKYDIIPLLISKDGRWMASDTALDILSGGPGVEIGTSLPDFRALRLDVVFPVLHGPYGEDGRLQGLLDMIDLPYV